MSKTQTSTPTLEQRVAALETKVKTLEAERPGRKAKPMLVVRQKGVCSLDPTRDSASCQDSSIYRYQSGCWGNACMAEQQAAYSRRKTKRAENAKEAVPTKKGRTKK